MEYRYASFDIHRYGMLTLRQDFRSKDGLYSLIQQAEEQRASEYPENDESSSLSKKRKFSAIDDELPPSSQASNCSTGSKVSAVGGRVKGKDLFDARVWKDPVSTATFYTFIASLRKRIQDEVKQTSHTHKFIRALRDGGRLMRCYTQNIDGLEAREGLTLDLSKGKGSKRRFMRKIFESPRPPQIEKDSDYDSGCEVVPLHGDLDKLRCNLCQTLVAWDGPVMDLFLQGEAPECQVCSSKAQNRRESGKRGLSVGLLRPNIVLYQEQHPAEHLLAPLPPFDIAQGPDMLIVMGTSLKVHGLQNLVREFAKAVHNRKGGRVVFVNRTKPSESIWNDFIDDWVSMDCDDWVTDLRTRREDLWLRQGDSDIKTTKPPKKRSSSPSFQIIDRAALLPNTNKVMVSVVIDKIKPPNLPAENPTTEPSKPKRPRKRKNTTTTPSTPPNQQDPTTATGLPSPPPSDKPKRPRQRKAKSKTSPTPQTNTLPSEPSSNSSSNNHTPWLPSTTALNFNSSPTPPTYSPLKPFTFGTTHTPWRTLPTCEYDQSRSQHQIRRYKRADFVIYADDESPEDISPILEQERVAAAAADASVSSANVLMNKNGNTNMNTMGARGIGMGMAKRMGIAICELLN